VSGLKFHKLRVAKVVEETPEARTIVFELPGELREAFRYKPGQHLTLRVPCTGKTVSRCYSLTSIPEADEHPRVTIKRMTDGLASHWLCGSLRAGDSLEVTAPNGMFTPRSLDGRLLMFAGGSGITPVYSIVRSVLASGRGTVRLLYANRDERSVIFAAELARLAREYPGRLQVTHWLDSLQGPPTQAQIAGFAGERVEGECYICGPGVFMDAAAAALHAIGVPASRIHVERFVSLPDEDQAAPVSMPTAETGEGTEVEVILDGATHKLTALPGQILIEALEGAGLQPPYSCRAGACAACMCQIEEGEVEMLQNHVLDESDLAQNWILACQSVAKSPRVKLKYPG
jgi:3-ketosteroid 9alpha-monooxygenase subunit B